MPREAKEGREAVERLAWARPGAARNEVISKRMIPNSGIAALFSINQGHL